ncbi:MAG: hypothetical protein K8R36_24870 [Planctomycetales bacterium]|nr:hypothetical protein [Planctomycetales bacterium]
MKNDDSKCKLRGIRTAWGMTLLLCAAVVGCKTRTADDYRPSKELCRQALSAALDAWKLGESPGRIEGTPAVQVGDTLRRPGQKLVSYEILGETAGDQGRQFAARVVFANPAAEEKINYIVIGIDPIWVFRQEEYDMVTHWEHKMSSEVAGDSQPAQALKK